jgi:hypothetical protein
MHNSRRRLMICQALDARAYSVSTYQSSTADAADGTWTLLKRRRRLGLLERVPSSTGAGGVIADGGGQHGFSTIPSRCVIARQQYTNSIRQGRSAILVSSVIPLRITGSERLVFWETTATLPKVLTLRRRRWGGGGAHQHTSIPPSAWANKTCDDWHRADHSRNSWPCNVCRDRHQCYGVGGNIRRTLYTGGTIAYSHGVQKQLHPTNTERRTLTIFGRGGRPPNTA